MKEVFDSYAENAFDQSKQDYMLYIKRLWYGYNFETFLPGDKNAKILDIGPGMGEFLITLGDWGYKNCEGLDISSSVVDFCIAKGLQCILTTSTEEWLEEHPNTFELITLFDVIEHLQKDQLVRFMTACKTALTDNGKIIIEVPNLQSPEGYLHRYNDITHEIGFVEHTLEQVLHVSGFVNFKCYPFEEYPQEDEDTARLRKIRAFYWYMTTAMRKLTHNLEPKILTPEFFAVAYKSNDVVVLPATKVLLENNSLTTEDLEYLCQKYELQIEPLNQTKALNERCNDLQRQISDLAGWNNNLQEQIIAEGKYRDERSVRDNDLQRQISDLVNWNNSLQEQINVSEVQHNDLQRQVSNLTECNNSLLEHINRIPEFLLKKVKGRR